MPLYTLRLRCVARSVSVECMQCDLGSRCISSSHASLAAKQGTLWSIEQVKPEGLFENARFHARLADDSCARSH